MGPRRCADRCGRRAPTSKGASRAGDLGLEGTALTLGRTRHSNLQAARQRSVTEKEVMLAEKRAARMDDVGCRVGVRQGGRQGGGEEGEDWHGRHKRQRVCGTDPMPGWTLEKDVDGGLEDRIEMDVDRMQGMDAAGGEAMPCSPSRKPWQRRPTPETRPDEHGTLTRAWVPPVSPYGLIEEDEMVYSDPFKLLVVCQLLNKTGATMVRHVIYREKFFDRYPSPEALANAQTSELEVLLQPLGLWRKRAVGLKRFAREYRELFWDPYVASYVVNANTRVGDLYGCGSYAVDAYEIFVLGAWRGLRPNDKDLRRYVEFLERTEGVGVGFTRGGASAADVVVPEPVGRCVG